jgi:hypothetical protein
MDFHLDFMKPDVWNGLVLGSVLIGLALGVLRLMRDRAEYRLQQRDDTAPADRDD